MPKKLDTILCMLVFADEAALVFVSIEVSVFVLLILFILPLTVFAFAECCS